MLGNTNVLVVAAMVPALFGRSRPRNAASRGRRHCRLARPRPGAAGPPGRAGLGGHGGILLAPIAGTYSALPIVLALPAIGPLAPAPALVIVAISPIATTHPLPFCAAGIMLASLALRERRTASENMGLPPAATSQAIARA
jgi:hypothetical protein